MSPRLERYVRQRYGPERADEVLARLRTWRIGYESEPPSERLIAAVLFVAEDNGGDLRPGLHMADRDWRDLLVVAGLAHGDWPRVLRRRLGRT